MKVKLYSALTQKLLNALYSRSLNLEDFLKRIKYSYLDSLKTSTNSLTHSLHVRAHTSARCVAQTVKVKYFIRRIHQTLNILHTKEH